MTVQVIKQGGKHEWAVVPYQKYLELLEKAEMLQDVQDYDSARMSLEEGKEELLPESFVNELLEGANPVKVWREYRGMTQKKLADAAGISIPYLSQLETGKRKGSLEVYSAIATALSLTLDDIV
ncbi:MAG: helix-turn-helix transcriptional regulator [Chlorobiales bacterium]|nr:helix-turn-helix transcriptional regulator [Chlorobiales bacterium]